MRFVMVVVITMMACWPGRTPARRRPAVAPRPSNPAPVSGGAIDSVGPKVLAGTLVIAVTGAVIGSPLFAVATPIVVVGGWREYTRQSRNCSERARSMAMVEFTEAVVAGLRAGGSLSTSVARAIEGDRVGWEGSSAASNPGRSTTRRHPGLQAVAAALEAGRTLAAAFADPFDRDGVSSDDRLVATTIVELSRSGGAAVEALERVVDTLRERQAWQEDRRTQSQQALSSAAVMSMLPLVFGVTAALVDEEVSSLYRTQWPGAVCGGSALLLTLLGWEWQQRLLAAGR